MEYLKNNFNELHNNCDLHTFYGTRVEFSTNSKSPIYYYKYNTLPLLKQQKEINEIKNGSSIYLEGGEYICFVVIENGKRVYSNNYFNKNSIKNYCENDVIYFRYKDIYFNITTNDIFNIDMASYNNNNQLYYGSILMKNLFFKYNVTETLTDDFHVKNINVYIQRLHAERKYDFGIIIPRIKKCKCKIYVQKNNEKINEIQKKIKNSRSDCIPLFDNGHDQVKLKIVFNKPQLRSYLSKKLPLHKFYLKNGKGVDVIKDIYENIKNIQIPNKHSTIVRAYPKFGKAKDWFNHPTYTSVECPDLHVYKWDELFI